MGRSPTPIGSVFLYPRTGHKLLPRDPPEPELGLPAPGLKVSTLLPLGGFSCAFLLKMPDNLS